MIAFKRGRIEVRAVDASGVHDGFSARARDEYRQFASSVGADGTAAVAWTNDEVGGGNERGTGTVWVRIRAAGRSRFSAPVRVTAQGAVRQLDVDVGPGGEVELIYAFWDPARNHHVIHHIYISESGLPGAGSTVATTDAGIAFLLRVLAAGPGASRVVYDSGDGYAERAVWRSRTSVTQWGDSQRLERDSADDFAAVEHLGAGGAAMAYERGGRVLLRVAAPNEPFGEPRVAGDVPQRWLADRTSIASNARGDILVAWEEFTDETTPLCGEDSCFGRIVAATTSAGQPFEATRTLSPLGTVLADFARVATALSPDGQRLVAWRTGARELRSPRSLWTALGDRAPTPAAKSDSRAPRVDVDFGRRPFRRAARTGQLRLAMRSSERVAIRFALYDSSRDVGTEGLRPALLPARRKTTTPAWRLGRRDRRLVRRALDTGALALTGTATDPAGNLLRFAVRAR